MSLSLRLAGLAGILAASAASAADLPLLAQPAAPPPPTAIDGSGFYAHLGAAGAFPDAGAAIDTPMGRLPGATIRIAPLAAFVAEGGYRFTPNWAVSLSAGYPPTARVEAAGTIRPEGVLGTNTGGVVALTAHYHFTQLGALEPYVGGGPSAFISFSDHDAALRRFDVRSSWGAAAQAGAEYRLTEHVGLFLDAKWVYLHTRASGLDGPVPLTAKVTLDPFILSGGLLLRL